MVPEDIMDDDQGGVESFSSSDDEAVNDSYAEFAERIQKEYTMVESEADHSIIGFYNNARTGWNGYDSTSLMHIEDNRI